MRFTTGQRLLLFGPLIVVLGLGLIGPALLGFLATFSSYAPGNATIRFVGVENYAAVLRDRQFGSAVRNIFFFTILAVPLELSVGFGVAYVLMWRSRGRGLWRVLLLTPWHISPIASGVMWHFLFGSGQGLLGFAVGALGLHEVPSPLSQHGLALLTTVAVEAWRVAPLVAFLLLPGLTAISAEKWEHATIEGASWIDRIRHVALPSIRPLALAVTMLLIGISLGTFDAVLILTGGGPGTETVTPALFSYTAAFQLSNWPVGTTAAWLIVAAVVVVGSAYLRLAARDSP